jgi:hypothetical protein
LEPAEERRNEQVHQNHGPSLRHLATTFSDTTGKKRATWSKAPNKPGESGSPHWTISATGSSVVRRERSNQL